MRAAVFGAGSWGTAFSQVLADAGAEVTIWARRREVWDASNAPGHNPDYWTHVELPSTVRATHDPAEAVKDAELVVLAVTTQRLRENLVEWAPVLPTDAVLLSLMKGVELGTSKRMSEVIADVTGAGSDRICVLSGPNLAGEIAARQPTASVIASAAEDLAARAQQVCHTPYFRPYTNTDIVGTELGGAVKNVVALAVGIASDIKIGRAHV